MATNMPYMPEACKKGRRHSLLTARPSVWPRDWRRSPNLAGPLFPRHVAKAKADELHLERTVWALRRSIEPERHAGRGGERPGRDSERP